MPLTVPGALNVTSPTPVLRSWQPLAFQFMGVSLAQGDRFQFTASVSDVCVATADGWHNVSGATVGLNGSTVAATLELPPAVYVVCYSPGDCAGQRLNESFVVAGLLDVATQPPQPVLGVAFNVTAVGVGLGVADEAALISTGGDCSAAAYAAVAAPAANVSHSVVSLGGLLLPPGLYHLCYRLAGQLSPHNFTVAVRGPTNYTTQPPAPLQGRPFNLTLQGVLLSD
eukprot:EG_transcript_28608